MNKHLHDLPTVSSDTCSWVGVVDTDDAILTVLFDNNGLNIREFMCDVFEFDCDLNSNSL